MKVEDFRALEKKPGMLFRVRRGPYSSIRLVAPLVKVFKDTVVLDFSAEGCGHVDYRNFRAEEIELAEVTHG